MDNSPFNKLAAEIRNHIYYYALVQDDPIILNVKAKQISSEGVRILALTNTCNQIRSESLSIFLGYNTFKVTPAIPYGDEDLYSTTPVTVAVRRWMEELGDWADFVRHLKVELDLKYLDTLEYWREAAVFAMEELNVLLRRPKLRLAVMLNKSWKRFGDFALAVDMNGKNTEEILDKLDQDCQKLRARDIGEMEACWKKTLLLQRLDAFLPQLQEGIAHVREGIDNDYT